MELELPADHWIWPVLSMLAMASCALWLWILLRKLQRQPLIPFSPRRPVPWSNMGAFLALLMAILALAGLATSGEAGLEELSVEESVQQIVRSTLVIASMTAVALWLIATAYRANWHDLGLPNSFRQFWGDSALGVAGFLAALVPVFGMQAALVHALDEPSQHPLITKLLINPDPKLLIVGFLTAVVVAPVCEEIAFRLLLQGWLEKWWYGRKASSDYEAPAEHWDADAHMNVLEPPLADDPPGQPSQSMFALPPILGSSLVFAVAHIGHGPDPIAIFLLALILGYLYQRTHRIVPCIVMHMLFNAFSLFVLMTFIFARQQ